MLVPAPSFNSLPARQQLCPASYKRRRAGLRWAACHQWRDCHSAGELAKLTAAQQDDHCLCQPNRAEDGEAPALAPWSCSALKPSHPAAPLPVGSIYTAVLRHYLRSLQPPAAASMEISSEHCTKKAPDRLGAKSRLGPVLKALPASSCSELPHSALPGKPPSALLGDGHGVCGS